MTEPADPRSTAWAELAVATTTSLRLAHIAQQHPEFADVIARHPNAYPELVDWARTVGGAGAVPESAVSSAGEPVLEKGLGVVAAHGAVVAASPSIPLQSSGPVRPTRAAPAARAPRWAGIAWIAAAVLFTLPQLILAVVALIDPSMYYFWVEYGLPGSFEFGWGWRIDVVQGAYLVAYLAALAGAIGAPTTGRRAGAVVTWAIAAVIPVVAPVIGLSSEFPSTPLSPITIGWISFAGVLIGFLVGVLMLTSWILSRPLHGAAFATIAVFFVGVAVEYVLGRSFSGTALYLLLTALVLPALVVFLALVFSRATERRRERPGVAVGPRAYGAQAGAPRTNTMAILSLVFAFVISVLAVVFGHVALGQIRRTGEEGRGFAITGLILGYAGIVGGAIGIIVWLVLFSTFVRGY